MNILHLDSSILGDASVSRGTSAKIVARLNELHPKSNVVYRDLTQDAPMHLSDRHLAATHGGLKPDATLAADIELGTTYLDELFAADTLVIGAPMYNYNIPSPLKAWIDRIVVVGRTFKYDANGVEGLVKGKKVWPAAGSMDTEAGATWTPAAATSSAASSGMVMSSFSATRPSRNARCGSSLE